MSAEQVPGSWFLYPRAVGTALPAAGFAVPGFARNLQEPQEPERLTTQCGVEELARVGHSHARLCVHAQRLTLTRDNRRP